MSDRGEEQEFNYNATPPPIPPPRSTDPQSTVSPGPGILTSIPPIDDDAVRGTGNDVVGAFRDFLFDDAVGGLPLRSGNVPFFSSTRWQSAPPSERTVNTVSCLRWRRIHSWTYDVCSAHPFWRTAFGTHHIRTDGNLYGAARAACNRVVWRNPFHTQAICTRMVSLRYANVCALRNALN